jgi:tetratricopeptide (TPR) repeat protein
MKINPGRLGTILLLLGAISGSAPAATMSGTNRQAVAIDPKVVGLVKQAGSELKVDQYDAAIRHLSAALQLKPEMKTAAVIYAWRADAYIHKGELNKAMSDASESIRLNPRDDHGYLERGIVYRRTGSLDKAISDYDTVIRLNPNFARTYYDRAIAYGLKGDYNRAIRDETEAIRLNTNAVDIADFYYNRGVSYESMGHFDKALADYNKAIHLAPNQLQNYRGRASVFEDTDQLDKARADYDRVTRLNPRDTNDYRFRGSAHFAKGDYKAAASDFQMAAHLSLRDYDALVSLAWFEATCPEDPLRNGKQALEISLRACERSRWQSFWAVDALAAAYAEIGDFDRAVRYQTEALNMKGVYALNRKKMQERLELYRQHKPYRKQSKFKSH